MWKKYDELYNIFKTNNIVYDFRIDSYKNKHKHKNMHRICGNPKFEVFMKTKLCYGEVGRIVV